MASKRTVTRRGSGQRGELKTVRKLTGSAKAELAKLLRRNRAGTISRLDLDTGLEELEALLKKILMHEFRL
jgi:hypothetical protein